jgi:hypothetical protein
VGISLRRGLWAVGIAALTLTAGCASQDPEPPKPEPLTASAAGAVYLVAVCPVNEAWDRVDLELDRLRLELRGGGADTRDLALALREMAVASETAAKELALKDRAWPETAKAPIAEVRDTLLADKKQAEKVATLSAKEVASYVWKGSEEIAQSGVDARAALELPADPELACAQWAEQHTSDKDSDKTKEPSD